MNRNNNLNSDLIDRKYKLKYYYWIDIDSLIENIRYQINRQKGATDFHIFHCIFKALYHSPDCSHYFNFLTSESSFNFSTLRNKKFLAGCHYIFETILENHCILYGFYQTLHQNPGQKIRISAKTTKERKEKSFGQYDNTLAQNYNKYKLRFQKFSENYSYQYLKEHYSFSETTGFPVAFEYNEPLARFLFTQFSIRTFDANVGKPSSLKYYQTLFCEIKRFQNGWKDKNNDYCGNCFGEICKCSRKNAQKLPQIASLTFEYSIEYLYGFSFFRSVFELWNYIYNKAAYTSNSPKSTCKKHHILYHPEFRIMLENLSGDPTLDLISQVASLPMVYNRYFFLQYILYNIVSSEKLERDILPLGKHSLFEQLPGAPASNFYLIEDGLSRAGNYIQRMHYIVLPLLEDLWSVITHELSEINLQTYEQYISSNSDILSFDFSSYEIHDFEEIENFSLQENKKTFYTKLREKASKSFPKIDTLLDSVSKPHAVKLLNNYLTYSRIDNIPKDTTEQLFVSSSDGTSKSLKAQHTDMLSDFAKKIFK